MALIFLTYVYMGDILTAEKAFLTLALYNVVRLSMSLFFPTGIQLASEGLISIKRIEDFLLMEELDEASAANVISVTVDQAEGSLQLSEVTGKWNEKEVNNTLENISFEATSGTLTALVGPVGSGKGSVLHAILGEMPTQSGKIQINGSTSYASQEPWVFSGSVRQNILFGQAYDADRYQKVLNVCALEHDISKMDHGDLTLVGERGVSLSGGQKARVNLGRAIYRDADIYLLDDPLSAVDAHVGKHLFEECIKNFLKDKVVLLVTHQIQYLKEADNILVLRQGLITHQGHYEHILEQCQDISTFITEEKEDDDKDTSEKIEITKIDKEDSEVNESTAMLPKQMSNNGPKEAEETAKLGTVSKHVYWGYVKSGANLCTGFILVLATICTHGCFSLSDMWIRRWTNTEDLQLQDYHHHEAEAVNSNETLVQALQRIEESNQFNLMIYAILVLCLIIACGIQTVQYYVICMTASRNLHDRMFDKILRAQPRFFDVNPSGRILNRFSKDLGSMDEVLPMTILDVKWIFLNILCVFIVITYIRPYIILPTLVISVIFIYLRSFYLKTSRSVKRLEGITKSPIFTQLSSSLNGLTSIRAFKAQEMMVEEFDYHQDIHSSAWFSHLATTRWFGVYLDWIVVLYLACCVLSFLLMPADVLGGDVGVAITSCIFLTGALQYGMRQSAEAENLMTSVERVMEYGQLPSEADLIRKVEDNKNEENFSHGKIVFDNVCLRYDADSGKKVLNNVTFATEASEKIGIVGRTGAGKSSLIVALFRLTEIESGKISIDEMDCAKMGLHELRKRISIIPQDPLLFSTTLRKNLDPFDQYQESDIWSALEQVIPLQHACKRRIGKLTTT